MCSVQVLGPAAGAGADLGPGPGSGAGPVAGTGPDQCHVTGPNTAQICLLSGILTVLTS